MLPNEFDLEKVLLRRNEELEKTDTVDLDNLIEELLQENAFTTKKDIAFFLLENLQEINQYPIEYVEVVDEFLTDDYIKQINDMN